MAHVCDKSTEIGGYLVPKDAIVHGFLRKSMSDPKVLNKCTILINFDLCISPVPKPTHFFDFENFPTLNFHKKFCTLFRIKNSFSS